MLDESGQYHFQEFWDPLFHTHTQKFRFSHALKYQLVRSGQIEIIHVSRQITTLDNPEICEVVICAMVKSRVLLGMVIPPVTGILVMGIKTPTIGLMTIPYYMEIMGV